MSAASSVSVANALASNVDVSDGVEEPLVLGNILGQPPRQGINRGPEPLQTKSDISSFGKLEKFRAGFVCAWPSMYKGSVNLNIKIELRVSLLS